MPCALSAAMASVVLTDAVEAQTRGDAPIAPAATIGPVTEAPTLSVLGIAAVPDGSGSPLAQRNDLWLGATQPIGRIGRVRLSALGSGNWRFREAVGNDAQSQGIVTVRARARIGEQRVWSAVSYGYAGGSGNPAGGPLSSAPGVLAGGGVDTRGADTTVSRRIDIGQVGRAEAGVMSRVRGVEFSVGMSLERATRVTTQTIVVDEPAALPLSPTAGDRVLSSRSVRTMQRRDLATGNRVGDTAQRAYDVGRHLDLGQRERDGPALPHGP